MKAVFFDIDNTLLIKKPGIPAKWREVLCDAGYNVTEDDAQRAFAECEMWVGSQTAIENKTGIRLGDEDFFNGLMGCCTDAFGLPVKTSDILAPIWAGRYEKRYELAVC